MSDARSLAMALVAESFGVDNGELVIGGVGARALVEAYGSPLYVYDEGVMRRRFRALKAAVDGFARVFYSIKANPAVARVFVEEGAGLEVASGAEYLQARAAGAEPESILFAGPGKSAKELDLAIAGGIGEIHLECFEEIEIVARLAARLGRRVPVAIRVNPGPGAQGGAMRMGGKPLAFGFDEEILDEVVCAVTRHAALDLSGLHLFAGTQILDAKVLLAQWAYGLGLAVRLGGLIGRPLRRIDLGGGLGIPYHQGDGALDLAAVSQGVRRLIGERAADPLLRSAEIVIEPGRYLAGPAGVYLMRVRNVKLSRGQRFIVADGGMHHQLAASGNLGQIIKRDYPIVAATRLDAPLLGDTQLVGPLCTPLDTLGRQTALPQLVAGDIVAVLQSGAYGLSASPVGFLGHPMPAEAMAQDGGHRLIRRAGDFSAPLVNLTLEPVASA
ncbi:MAG: diaminopimelate decarboxylase [Methylocystis sp.]|nr:MAG: diaminopimelate decarboxylase [Methylocystis sp.]